MLISREEVQKLKAERDKAVAESNRATAELKKNVNDKATRSQRSEDEIREARQEAFATGLCIISMTSPAFLHLHMCCIHVPRVGFE
jgi:hypothetical protein